MDGAYVDPVSCGGADSTNNTAEGSTLVPDFSTFDIVKATQYGASDRVRHLVEVEGFDVNARDKDGVTLLHWAAINNRGSIADFLLEKGCEVDAAGGELRSCPIHWAVRQGHLAMVVKLMKAGADPTFKDSEGYNCLHLACQLGHTLIAGYVVAKGCPVNIADDKGMTPLMWSCLRVTLSNDPTRMLISLGASLTMVDMVHGNTPLHWAIVGKSDYAMTITSKNSATDFTAQNSNGETPIDMFEKSFKGAETDRSQTSERISEQVRCGGPEEWYQVRVSEPDPSRGPDSIQQFVHQADAADHDRSAREGTCDQGIAAFPAVKHRNGVRP